MNTPLYKEVYNTLKRQIEDDTYPVGKTLPTEKELAVIFSVSTITIKRALELLKEEGYILRKPRKGSEVIRNRRSKLPIENKKTTLGVILTNFSDFFGAQILRSILTTHDDDINFIVKISYGDEEQENRLIGELIDTGIQGLILLPSSSEYTSPKLLSLITKEFPIVVIDRSMSNLPICSVQTDSRAAAKSLTSYLFENGHRKVGLISSDNHVSTIDERINGFLEAHIEAGLPVSQHQILSTIDSVVPNSHETPADDINRIVKFLWENQDLSAILTTEFNIALLAKNAIQDIGKNVPDDFSLVCFDHPTLNIFDPQAFTITHIEQEQNDFGKQAVDLLLKKIQNPKLIQKINLGYSLIEGNSVRNI